MYVKLEFVLVQYIISLSYFECLLFGRGNEITTDESCRSQHFSHKRVGLTGL